MHVEYKAIPVGTEGEHVVQRTMNGTVSYLGRGTEVRRLTFGTAVATCSIFAGHPAYAESYMDQWVPWHTDLLSYRKPFSVFPPQRVSSFDSSARA